jgi:hypothetical protein
MIEDVSVNVGADVAIEQPELPILDKPVRIFEIDQPGAHRLDLGSGQSDAELKFFQQEIVMRSDPIYSSIALAGGGGIAARILFRIGLGLVRSWTSHISFRLSHWRVGLGAGGDTFALVHSGVPRWD